MLLSRFRPTAIIAMTLALTMLGQIGWGDEPSARDEHARVVRSGPQRSEHTDSISHDADIEIPELGVTPTSTSANSGRLDVHAPPGRTILAAAQLRWGPSKEFLLLRPITTHPIVIDRPHRPSLGRAPPTA